MSLGEATTDEMMLIYFAYTYYQAGDENIVIDNTPLVDITDSTTVGIEEPAENAIVSTAQLYEPMPNPANNETTFTYYLPHTTAALIRVYDLSGRMLEEISGPGHAGFNSVKFDTGKLANGEYLYTLHSDGVVKSKHLVVGR